MADSDPVPVVFTVGELKALLSAATVGLFAIYHWVNPPSDAEKVIFKSTIDEFLVAIRPLGMDGWNAMNARIEQQGDDFPTTELKRNLGAPRVKERKSEPPVM